MDENKMNKEEIEIPYGVEFISQDKNYKLPRGEHCIVDKGVTGCGYTEFCLTNEDWIVLCSPRKLLLENKSEKHKKENHENILYLEASLNSDFYDIICRHLELCKIKELTPKFMITYDSTWKISDCLLSLGLLDNFIFVVDEFQSIFLDSYFKVGVEFDFVNGLQKCKSVIYLSATPMLDKYLVDVPEFCNLKFYKLIWDKTGFVETISIGRKKTNSLTAECCKIVNQYLSGNYPMTTDKNNIVYQSTEAVFYFNSVAEILRVVRKCGLTPENTLIICSKSDSNEKKLKKEGFSFGKIPLEDELNPMFTFCTSAVYMGVDFHSECASSYIFADPNISCLALDISLDLPQIIGRQRNKQNPFKNYIVLFYKTKRSDGIAFTEENFKKYQEGKKMKTLALLDLYETATESQKEAYVEKLYVDVENSKYSRDFVSISERTGKPVYNTLIDIADRRAWDVSREDYQDTLSVTKAIQDLESIKTVVEEYQDEDEQILKDFLDNCFYSTGIFADKMKMYCHFRDMFKDNKYIIEGLEKRIKDPKYHQYYKYYGTQGCSAKNYKEIELQRGWLDETKGDKLKTIIYSKFHEGEKYTLKDLKDSLREIYSSLSMSKSPKASDMSIYFNLTRSNINTKDGIKHGFKLGKRLL